MPTMPRMLEGYRVLDFTQFVAGPTCTRILAEMGAEVIKLELAPAGDRVRGGGLKPLKPEFKDSSTSTYYLQHNHSKLSFAIDLKQPGARELVMSMVPKVDVIVENFAPGVIKRLGFAYEDVKKVNPKIIMCSISMAGQTGPLAYKAGYDYIGQAYAGVTDGIGEADRAPALVHRERTGEGQYLDASLTDTYFHMHEASTPMVALRGAKFRKTRNGSQHPDGGPTGVYHFKGDQFILLTIPTPHQWRAFCRAMGTPALADDPRFKNARGRRDNDGELKVIIEDWMRGFETRDDVLAVLDKERVPCAPVLTVNEAVHHPHLNERKTVRWIDDPLLGKLALPGVPVKFSAWPDRTELRTARLGEDNEQVLHELLNLPDDQIKKLYADGVLVRDATLASAAPKG